MELVVVIVIIICTIGFIWDVTDKNPNSQVTTYSKEDKVENILESEVEFVDKEKFVNEQRLGIEPTMSYSKVLGRRILVESTHTYTKYYITFELEDGQRIELNVGGESYGLIIEGDVGEIYYMKNSLIRFNRRIEDKNEKIS